MRYKITKLGIKNLETNVEFQAIPTLPEYIEYLAWQENGGIVQPEFTDLELLENAKKEKINALKLADYAKLELGFVAQTIKMNATKEDVVNLKLAYELEETLVATDIKMSITDYDNNEHVLSLETVKLILIELGVNLKTIRANFIAKRKLIVGAIDVESLKKIQE